MLQIPAQTITKFTTYITGQGIPTEKKGYYVKWVKYYLDFCHKYQFKQGTDVSLSAFLKKLGQKRQPSYLQEQAEHAVQLLFSCTHPSELQPDFISKDKKLQVNEILPNTNSNNRQENKVLENPPRQTEARAAGEKTSKITGTDWTNIFTELKNTIRVRHYSPATLKTYTGWVRKFQAFTQSKDPKLLTTDDVKNYLRR